MMLIAIVLLAPVACFSHPCDGNHAAAAAEMQRELASSDGCPVQHEVDFCETSCCCADYVERAPFTGVAYSPDIRRNLIPPRITALPDVPDRIYVPPQNRFRSA